MLTNGGAIKARWIALGVLTGLLLYLCWLIIKPLVGVLEWATVLAILFYPIHKRIAAWTRRPNLSALISTLLIVLLIVVPVGFAAVAIVGEIKGVVQSLKSGNAFFRPDSPIATWFVQRLSPYIDLQNIDWRQLLIDRLNSISGTIATQTIGLVGGFIGIVIETVFVLFTLYYLFRDGHKIARILPLLLPVERSDAERIIARGTEVISAGIYGVVVIAIIQGIAGGLAFWFLGLPAPLLWTVVMIFLAMIPMAGAPIVWIPAAISLVVTGHWVKAIILAAWGFFVIHPIDNFARPKIVGGKARMHDLLIFLSVVGGIEVFGFLGIVLGPLVFAVTYSVLDVFRHPLNHRLEEEPQKKSSELEFS